MIELIRDVLGSHFPRRVDTKGRALAAVLLLLYERDENLHVLYTKRTELVEHHKGQISFPGGAHEEADDDLRQTALRETFEEIGVLADHVEVVGELDEILTISNFVVSPFVGVLTQPGPYEFQFNAYEVAEILEVPLAHLRDARHYRVDRQIRDGIPVVMHEYAFGRHVIWGATGRITRQFLELIEAAMDGQEDR